MYGIKIHLRRRYAVENADSHHDLLVKCFYAIFVMKNKIADIMNKNYLIIFM